LREMIRPDSVCAELVRDSIRPQFELLLSILRELLPHAPQDRLELLAFSTVGQSVFYRLANPVVQQLLGPEKYQGLTVDKLADHITTVMLAVIREAATDEDRAAKKSLSQEQSGDLRSRPVARSGDRPQHGFGIDT